MNQIFAGLCILFTAFFFYESFFYISFLYIPLFFVGIYFLDTISSITHFLFDNYSFKRIQFLNTIHVRFVNHHVNRQSLEGDHWFRLFGEVSLLLFIFNVGFFVIWNSYPSFSFAFFIFNSFGLCLQPIHREAHRENTNLLVQILRKLKILITPESHEEHHKILNGKYAMISGWSNPLMDRIYKRIK